MIIIDLFDIDFHIFTVIKFLFNLGVRFNYIYNEEEKDSIASRMKRRRNKQPNDDDDKNNSYEY